MTKPVSCPHCGAAPEAGFAELRRSFIGSFFGRKGTAVFQFVSETTGERDILAPSQRRVAYACGRCGTTVITGEAWLP